MLIHELSVERYVIGGDCILKKTVLKIWGCECDGGNFVRDVGLQELW